MRILIQITDEQYDKALEMWRKHTETCGWASGEIYAGAIGGCQSWVGTATSLGQLISIQCTCGWSFLANGDDL